MLLVVITCAGVSACQSPQDRSYLDAVNRHNPTLKARIDTTTAACKDAPSPACATAARDAKAEADAYLGDLKGQTAPSCIADADAKLRAGLSTFSSALQALSDAAAASDVTGGNTALDSLQKGIDAYNGAVDSANKASC
jgi:hypothetical protein